MENGFRKAAHTADVDMECCTVSHRSFTVTVVSTITDLIITSYLYSRVCQFIVPNRASKLIR